MLLHVVMWLCVWRAALWLQLCAVGTCIQPDFAIWKVCDAFQATPLLGATACCVCVVAVIYLSVHHCDCVAVWVFPGHREVVAPVAGRVHAGRCLHRQRVSVHWAPGHLRAHHPISGELQNAATVPVVESGALSHTRSCHSTAGRAVWHHDELRLWNTRHSR